MAETIIDGTGSGYEVKVDSTNRLHVHSVTEDIPLARLAGRAGGRGLDQDS